MTKKAGNAKIIKAIIENLNHFEKKGKFKTLKKSLSELTEKVLADIVVQLKADYYSGDESVSDKVYDMIEDRLRYINPKSKALNTGSAKHELNKVTLPVPLASLDKILAPEVVNNFTDDDCDYVVSDKEDGVSALLHKINHNELRLYTRGKTLTGKDITPFIPHLKLPDIKKMPVGLLVRGEMALDEASFKKKWEGDKKDGKFKNSRAMVSGITNRQDLHKGLRDIKFIAYERCDKILRKSKQLASLKKMGFNVVPYVILSSKDTNYESLLELLIERKSKSPINIDGLVVHKDVPYGITASNPKVAKAFKSEATYERKKAKVLGIQWQLSRTGRYNPVVIIEPTNIGGTTIQKPTGHDARNIIENKIGKGAVIELIRAGDVIPQISKVIKKGKVELPPNSYLKGAYLYAKADVGNDIQVRQLVYFFHTLGVEGLKAGSIRKLLDFGFDLYSILKADKSEFVEVLGKNGIKIYDSLHRQLKSIDLPLLMTASGCFENMALNRATLIVENLGDITKLKLKKSMLELPTIGPKLQDNIIKGMPLFKDLLKKSGIKYNMPKVVKGGKLEGQQFVFSSYRNKEAEKRLINAGAKIGSGVTKKTTLLVTTGEGTSKDQAANKLGIKTMNPKEFETYLKKLGV